MQDDVRIFFFNGPYPDRRINVDAILQRFRGQSIVVKAFKSVESNGVPPKSVSDLREQGKKVDRWTDVADLESIEFLKKVGQQKIKSSEPEKQDVEDHSILWKDLVAKPLNLGSGEIVFRMKFGDGKILVAIKIENDLAGVFQQAVSMFVKNDGVTHWKYPTVDKAIESTESIIRNIAAGKAFVVESNKKLFVEAIANGKIVLAP